LAEDSQGYQQQRANNFGDTEQQLMAAIDSKVHRICIWGLGTGFVVERHSVR
jgi:hypothetical protein